MYRRWFTAEAVTIGNVEGAIRAVDEILVPVELTRAKSKSCGEVATYVHATG